MDVSVTRTMAPRDRKHFIGSSAKFRAYFAPHFCNCFKPAFLYREIKGESRALPVGGKLRHYIYDDDDNDKYNMLEYLGHLLKRRYLPTETYIATENAGTNEIEVEKPKYREILFGFSVYHVWLDGEYDWVYLCPCRVVDNEV